MNENEQKAGSVADQKSKIRERYKGIDPDELDVIPALPQEDIFAVENEQRVAVYARVSTDDPRQTSSYELQKNHYHDVISKSPNWKLVQIYADEGISGTSLQHRDQFKLMIEDCKKGQIDLIVTKSVSRFARNVWTASAMSGSFSHSPILSVFSLKRKDSTPLTPKVRWCFPSWPHLHREKAIPRVRS